LLQYVCNRRDHFVGFAKTALSRSRTNLLIAVIGGMTSANQIIVNETQ
jgi:hypothetical protein